MDFDGVGYLGVDIMDMNGGQARMGTATTTTATAAL